MTLSEAQEKEIQNRINQGNSEKVYFQSTIVWVGISITTIASVAVLIWATKSPNIVQFKDSLTTLLVGFACTTLIYASKTFEHNRYVNIYKIHLDARKSESDIKSAEGKRSDAAKIIAFDLMKDWHSAEMIEHATIVRAFFHAGHKDVCAALYEPQHVEARRSIMVVLNYFERIGLACQTKLADSALLKSYFRGLFNNYHRHLEAYITKRRQELDNHRLFIQYTSTIIQWRQEDN